MRFPSYQELSKEQDKINNLLLDKSYLITGAPGTGKTVMAIYRAEMLTRRRVATWLLMRSRLLSQYTSNAVVNLGINGVVNTFDSWLCAFFQRHYRSSPPSLEAWHYDWIGILRKVGARPPATGSLEHLIIDEGQDLPKEFYPIATRMAKCVTVFADENQRLFEQNSTLADIETYGGFHAKHRLTRNYRNTREIAALAEYFHTGHASELPSPPDRHGPKPVVIRHKNLFETVDYIARYERNHPDKQIGVFVPSGKQRQKLVNRLSVDGRTRLRPQTYEGGLGREAAVVDFESAGIIVLCDPSAKGLEFDTVFMPELQNARAEIHSAAFRMKYYVLLSRAREELYLQYSGEERPRILDAFPEELVEWR